MLYRDDLAKDRTMLANERTFLAYARTAIMLAVSGITMLKLFSESPGLVVLGYVLLPVALAVGLYGYLRFRNERRRLSTRHRKRSSKARATKPRE
jgi:putative membrane protein